MRILFFRLSLLLGLFLFNPAATYSQENGKAKTTLVTKSMAEKVASYMRTNFNSTTTVFNQANEITSVVDRDKILYNINEHYDCVENFMLQMLDIYGAEGSFLFFDAMRFTPQEYEIIINIYKQIRKKDPPSSKKIEQDESKQEESKVQERKIEHKEVAPEFPPCTYKNRKGKNVKNPGGQEGVYQYLNDVLKYPKEAFESGVEGKVVVSFVIIEDGSISEVKALSSPDSSLSREAIRVISEMPNWKPGTQDGKPVKVKMTIPVVFRAGF